MVKLVGAAVSVAISLWLFTHAAEESMRFSSAAMPASLPNTEDLNGLPTLLPSLSVAE